MAVLTGRAWLLALIQATASAIDVETVLAWIEEDLRAQVAKVVDQEEPSSA